MSDPTTDQQIYTHVRNFDLLEKTNDSYVKTNICDMDVNEAEHSEKYGGGVQFGADKDVKDESGVVSPPMWSGKNSPKNPVHLQHFPNSIRQISQTPKAEAIARGQKELMEMVKAMPESSYELSLKDLVEYHKVGIQEKTLDEEEKSVTKKVSVMKIQENPLDEEKSLSKKCSANKSEKKGKMVRTGSNIGNNKGLFLKMGIPMSLGGKKKKKAMPQSNVLDGSRIDEKSGKVIEKEWWRRRSSVSDESESGGGMSSISRSSGSSGSSDSSSRSSRGNNSRKKKGCLGKCSLFYYSRNSKSAK